MLSRGLCRVIVFLIVACSRCWI